VIDSAISIGTDFDGPGEYRILVQGRLGERWRDRVGGLEFSVREVQGGESQTELTGLLQDQAALMGVLQHLYARGIAIISVERVKRRTRPES